MIYRLKVVLKHTKPPIWRRIEVPDDITLSELHEVLQGVMGWHNCHLHQFVAGRTHRRPTSDEIVRAVREGKHVSAFMEQTYSDPRMELEDAEDERKVKLSGVMRQKGDKLLYEYDFGDGWEHEIRMEKVSEPEPGEQYPRCTGGARRGPMEDCGGPWGWEELVRIVNDPDDPEYEERREWMGLEEGEEFDAEGFDVAEANECVQPGREGSRQTDEDQQADPADLEAMEEMAKSLGLRLTSYKINTGPMRDSEYDLPKEAQSQMLELYRTAQSNPKEAINTLLGLLEKYPGSPRIYNYLGASYMNAGRREKAREVAEENYRRNPRYLFAKLNYAEFLLGDEDYERVREVMEDKWDISLHYPDRKEFHISEVIGVLYVAGRYFALTGDLEAAERYLEMLGELDTNCPQYERLEQLVFGKSIMHKMQQMTNRPRKPRKDKGKKRK